MSKILSNLTTSGIACLTGITIGSWYFTGSMVSSLFLIIFSATFFAATFFRIYFAQCNAKDEVTKNWEKWALIFAEDKNECKTKIPVEREKLSQKLDQRIKENIKNYIKFSIYGISTILGITLIRSIIGGIFKNNSFSSNSGRKNLLATDTLLITGMAHLCTSFFTKTINLETASEGNMELVSEDKNLGILNESINVIVGFGIGGLIGLSREGR